MIVNYKYKRDKEISFVLGICMFLFIFFFILFSLFDNREHIPSYLLFFEFLFAVANFCLVFYFGCSKIKQTKMFFILVFLFVLFSSIALRVSFVEITGKVFQDAVDSYTYDGFAKKSVLFDYGIIKHLKTVDIEMTSGLNLDDWGFNILLYSVYWLFGVEIGRWMMLILNASCVACSSVVMYKLFKLFNYKRRVIAFCLSTFSFFSFFPVTAAVGLKENVFVLFIVFSLYFTYKSKINGRTSDLLKALLSVAVVFLFRLPVGFMLLFSLLLCKIVNKRNYYMIIAATFGLLFVVYIFGAIFFQTLFGFSTDQLLDVSIHRLGGQSAEFGWFVQLLSSIIGPFPNFSRTVQYAIIFSYSLLLKCILSLFFIKAIFYSFKNGDCNYFWLIAYILMGVLMLTMAVVALDMRYHVTFFPAFMILIAYSLNNYRISKSEILLFSFFVSVIIYEYNIR